MLAENPPLEEHQYTYVDTLNTVWVDRFTKSHQFVIAPHPSQHSLAYFWQFMEELNITVIISLNEPQWCRQKCRIWPDKHHPQMNPSKSTSVKHDSTTKLKNYSWIKVVLTGVKKQTPIEILSLKNWPTASNCPEDIADFVNFCIETKDVLKGSNPVLVTCHDGLTASGLYVAMLYNIGRMKMEEVCDVCSSVRKIKSFRQDFLKSQEQFIFLWEAAENYLKEIQMYETV
jgi:protein tyrosine phosphatase